MIIIISVFYNSKLISENIAVDDESIVADKFEFPMNIGVFGGINRIKSFAIIPFFPNEFECGNFNSGTGGGFFLGINYGIEFFNSNIVADIRLFNETRPATLDSVSDCYEILDPTTNDYTISTRKHTYTVDFSYLALDFGLKLRLFKMAGDLSNVKFLYKIPIYTRVGYETGEAMFSKNYSNIEELTHPQGINYPNGTRQNTVEEGEYTETISSEAINFTLGAEFKIAKNTWLTPEISYRYELTQSIEKYDWDMEILRFGVGLSFDLNKEEIIYDFEEEQPEPIIEPDIEEPIISDKINQKEEKNNIEKFDFNEIDFTETIVTQTYPILPYIFYDSASSELRKIYKINKRNFNEKNLNNNTIDIYYNLINIIANRMNENPNSKIKLVGSTDGSEVKDSLELLSLAKSRAEKIKNIFDEFGIDRNRIDVEYREIPKLPTSDKYSEGLQENRRVDIETNNLELLKPVLHSDFLEYKLKQPIKFETKLKSLENVKSLIFNLKDGDNYLFSQYYDSPKKEIIHQVNEDILDKLAISFSENKDEKIITAEITINYDNNEIEKKSFNIPVYKEKSSYEVGRLNLIVFDFDKSEISKSNKNMIKQFISSSISVNSQTTITGSTDLLGEKDYNKSLSLARANEVANYIRQINSNYQIDKIEGLGSDKILFDNNTPEGRFYCRTVLVEVKTPITE